jgi:hypothetical protein
VHEGTSICSPPAAVHCGGGPTPWHSLTLTDLCKMSLWLLSSPSQLCRPGILSVVRLCLLLISHLPLVITFISVWYMYYLWSQYKMLIQKKRKKKDRSQRLILCRLVKAKLHQGVGPLPRCTAAGGEQRLAPLCTGSSPQ